MCKLLASQLRESNKDVGLLGVECLALPHGQNETEIACNVHMVRVNEEDARAKESVEKGELEKV